MPTLNESFAVPDQSSAYAVISDLNKLVPCVPGAKVLSADSPESVTAEIDVKMGSMAMVFAGPVKIQEQDGSSRVVIKADTKEKGGQSAAEGTVTIALSGGNGTIDAVANINGKAASMGEGTIVAVLTALVKQFTANVAKA